ncbi:hypothetical protein [Nocardia abscessus]|uniref:hypothetical protein n=1 Tax=Nocardia abscessus TaxID=120957 RepID=UPI00245569FD|nr:hypothetical protein [Nocardia abscessus]
MRSTRQRVRHSRTQRTTSSDLEVKPAGTGFRRTLIVAGYLRVTDRDRYLDHCREVVGRAPAPPGLRGGARGADLPYPERENASARGTPGPGVHRSRARGTSGDLDAQIVGRRRL